MQAISYVTLKYLHQKRKGKSAGKDEIKFKYSTEHVNVEQQKNWQKFVLCHYAIFTVHNLPVSFPVDLLLP